MQLASNPKTRAQARFVVFRVCCGELGNRLLGLASSLLFAFASNRALLIEWPEIEGFSGDSYDALFQPAHDMPVLLPVLLRQWQLPYASFTKQATTLELNNGHPDPYRELVCGNLSHAYSDSVFVVLSTNQVRDTRHARVSLSVSVSLSDFLPVLQRAFERTHTHVHACEHTFA